MGVCCVVLSEVVALLEGLPTAFAFVWFFARVNSLVNSNRRAVGEGFLAFVTFKNVLPCPDFLVFSYLGIFGEAFLI